MTRKQALAELIAKVEAGDATNDGSMFRVFGDKWTICFDAFHGSLDAAKALHEAMLPEWKWQVFAFTDCDYVAVLDGPDASTDEVGYPHTPARAWLLAILKALHTQEADQ